MSFQIEWVNHASYVLRSPGFELLTDPWLYGSVFQDGWDLVSPTRHPVEDLRKIKRVWLSHEHPDHFNPHFFKGYTADERKQVTVYFQETRDKRVVTFLRNQGFRVVELPDGKPWEEGNGIEFFCKKSGTEDSWLAVKIGDQVILNLNDCIFPDARAFAGADVLLSQFGYAEKVGDTSDVALRSAESKRWRRLLIDQTRALQARYVIPFASYKYFSHEDNFYMNQGASTPEQVLEDFEFAGMGERCRILYPGEKWDFGSPHDSVASVSAYRRDWEAIQPRHRVSKRHERTELASAAEDFLKRIRAIASPTLLMLLRHSPFAFGLRPIVIQVTDLGQMFVFDGRSGILPAEPGAQADISLASECLMQVFVHPYGANTLYVNGRFQAHTPHGMRTIFVWGHLGLMMGSNLRFDLRYLLRNSVRIVSFLRKRFQDAMPGV